MKQNEDEIDLLELARKILLNTSSYLERRYKLLLGAVGMGVILGLGHFYLNKNKLEQTIIGTSYVVPTKVVVDLINSIQAAKGGNDASFQNVLNLQAVEAASILSIHADTVATLSTLDKQAMTTIEVKVVHSGNFNLERFTKSLQTFIDSNNYVANELDMERQKCEQLIKKYDLELEMLHEFQTSILNEKNKQNLQTNNNYLTFSSKSADFYHKDVIDLEKEKQLELKKRQRITGFYLIDNKMGVSSQVASIWGSMIKLTSLAFGLALLLTFLLELSRYVSILKKEVHADFSVNKHIVQKQKIA